MTRRLLSLLAAAAVVVALTPVFVTITAAEMTCNIPFSFMVGDRQMPAGRYTFSTHGSSLLVRGDDRGAIIGTNGVLSRTDTRRRAVFEKIGELYMLREAWTGGGYGRELPRPRVTVVERYTSNAPVERVVILGS
jgi:hypothetical protein